MCRLRWNLYNLYNYVTLISLIYFILYYTYISYIPNAIAQSNISAHLTLKLLGSKVDCQRTRIILVRVRENIGRNIMLMESPMREQEIIIELSATT